MFCFRPIVNVCFRFFKLILFENLFKLRQCRLTVYMLLTSSVLSTTSKQCFELTSSVLFTTSKHCFEQPAASFLVCSLIVIEYYLNYNYIYVKSSAIKYKSQKHNSIIQRLNIYLIVKKCKNKLSENFLRFQNVCSFFAKF